MSGKIAKTLARQKEKIAEGAFYEAHQQLRVIASRYVKAADYNSAADILSNGAILLLKAGQGGSGADLCKMLLNDVYIKGGWECNEANRKRLAEMLKAFPRGEPTRKRVVQDMIGWSCRASAEQEDPGMDDNRGDPLLHHTAGSLLAEEGEAYEAERHLVQGTDASIPVLVEMHYRWYAMDSPHLAATYAARSIFPFLVLGNLSAATRSLQLFCSRLTSTNPNLFTQSIDSSRSQVRVFPSLPLLNFLSLLVLACQKAEPSLFKQLARHYAVHLKEVDEIWSSALANIGEIWFGIRIPNKSGGMANPLFDMMGSMIFGGGGGSQKPPALSNTPPPPRSATPGARAVEQTQSQPPPSVQQQQEHKTEPTAAPPPTMDLD